MTTKALPKHWLKAEARDVVVLAKLNKGSRAGTTSQGSNVRMEQMLGEGTRAGKHREHTEGLLQ